MSTKAERKRQEELRKRISLCLKVVFGVALLVLGVLHYHCNENNDIGDNYNTGIDTQKKSGNSSDKVLAEKETSGDKSSTKSEIVNKNEKNASKIINFFRQKMACHADLTRFGRHLRSGLISFFVIVTHTAIWYNKPS